MPGPLSIQKVNGELRHCTYDASPKEDHPFRHNSLHKPFSRCSKSGHTLTESVTIPYSDHTRNSVRSSRGMVIPDFRHSSRFTCVSDTSRRWAPVQRYFSRRTQRRCPKTDEPVPSGHEFQSRSFGIFNTSAASTIAGRGEASRTGVYRSTRWVF